MSVKQFSPRPGSTSGKPSLPDNFTVTPPTDGTKSTGNAPNLPSASAKGTKARKYDCKKNYASGEVKVSKDIPSRVVGEQDNWPDRVQSFDVVP